jgi:translation initiation factor 2 beta subunit (eIF-2beta)/eIF-5
MYSLEEVFKESVQDSETGILDSLEYEARLVRGIKIIRDNETGEVEIYNTTLGGDYYQEITTEQYELFKENGWKVAVYVISLSNYRKKLVKIEQRIKEELGGRKNAKSIKMSKSRRLTILKNFSEVSNKLKELQDE